MNKKEQQAQRAKQEDVVLNKVLWWIVGAVVLEVLLLLLNKVYANYTVEQIELAKSLRDDRPAHLLCRFADLGGRGPQIRQIHPPVLRAGRRDAGPGGLRRGNPRL